MNELQNFGPTLLRLGLGTVYLAHGAYLKLVVFTLAGTVGFFESLGLPAVAAYAVITAEVIGGALLIAGVRVREAALALTVVSLGATWVHSGAGWLFASEGGGWEYPLFLAVATAAQALLGAGALQLRLPRSTGRSRPVGARA